MKTVKVYDTVTKKMIDVAVSEEVYVNFYRTKWNIEDNNESFYKHEIQFSQLFDNIDCQTVSDVNIEEIAVNEVYIQNLKRALKVLPEKELLLIRMLFFDGRSERECAKFFGISQKNIHRNKIHILYKLNKLLGKTKN